MESLKSLFFIYTVRANQVLYDFVLEVRQVQQPKKISRETAQGFLLRATSDGKVPVWSDSIIARVSSYLISCLKDFYIIDKEGYIKKKILDSKVCNYLLHELHFKGFSDEKMVHDTIWTVLGLEFHELIKEIERISFRGTFIFQFSGDILKISWKYLNMEEFIENEYR
jgi:hypothetical protein